MAQVHLRQVRKSYGGVEAIHGVDIDIADGEFMVLVGPSGCGKSTLLRMVAGLETITGGTVSIGDRVVNDLEPKERDIAMVFQNYALYPHMTVGENMGFSLKYRGGDTAEVAARVAEAARILGLEQLVGRYPRQLSGGQRQRVAMGRAIVRDPQVFLFDEPLSNLDASLRVTMRGEIKALHQRLGTTTVYVTHDQVEAMSMADRIVVLRDGRVEQIGAPMDLYHHPANLFVAGFIGSPGMNFLDGTLAAGGVDLGTVSVPIAGATSAGLESSGWASSDMGRAVRLGIRPEDIRLAQDEARAVPATVELVEPLGGDTQITVRLGTARILVLSHEPVALRSGDALQLTFPVEKIHLFDADTGVALETAP